MLLFTLLILPLIFGACKKDKDGGQPPVITKITTLNDRGTGLGNATYSQWILIKGSHLSSTQKVDFNGVEVDASQIFANDTSVTVQVPGPLPGATKNPVTVYTRYGQATLDFNVLQPAPVITSFTPVSGGAGDVVTITGDWFTNLVGVKFGTVDATVVSSTKTEIKVTVPDGVSQAYLIVTTSGGTTQSTGAFGFKYVMMMY